MAGMDSIGGLGQTDNFSMQNAMSGATKQRIAGAGAGNYYTGGAQDDNPYSQQDIKSYNGATAEQNYLKQLPGGQWSSDPYEAAQQKRNFHQSSGFQQNFDPLNPGQQLTEQLGTSAYNFRTGLTSSENDASNDIKNQAGTALDQGIRQTREGANSRGLLYSGLREGAEQGVRGRVANAMASQINQSNSDLNKAADARDNTAAQAALGQAAAAQAAQAEVDKANSENAVFRAQQMQQISGAAGYGFGQLYGGAGKPQQDTGLTQPQVGSQYASNPDPYKGILGSNNMQFDQNKYGVP